jgi:hypothetical protein
MAGSQKQQQGAALVVVLAMLSMTLMLGLSGMNSSFVNERLAGNYRAMAQAQMATENGAAELSDFLFQLNDSSVSVTSVLDVTELSDRLEQPIGLWVKCDDAERWSDDAVFSLQLAQGLAKLLPCRDEAAGNVPHFLVEGRVGDAVHIALMELDPLTTSHGLAATNFIGGIASDATIQWPSSQQSRLGATDEHGNVDPDWPAIYFDRLQGEAFEGTDTYDKQALLSSMDDTSKVVNGDPSDVVVEATPSAEQLAQMIDFLKNIHDTCASSTDGGGNQGGKNNSSESLCDHIRVVPPGESDSLRGNTTFEGLYIHLGGEMDIRGNADIRGSAIVANIEVKPDGTWVSHPSETIKLAGGGNKGTVWLDAWHVQKAIDELKQKAPVLFADLDMETIWGGGQSSGSSGYRRTGWIQDYW